MARIKTYNTDSDIDPADKVIGTDGKPGQTYGNTKNYSFSSLLNYFQGNQGEAGASAYQIWLNNGNTGTEQDFLASLIGAPGAQGPTGAAGSQGAAGADGTSINIQGLKETVGDLPVSGSLGDLWIINTAGGGANAGDGYVWTDGGQWLNIGPLRGPQGIQGAQGAQGIQGIQGQQGIQGIQGLPGNDGSQMELDGCKVVICDSNGDTPGDYGNLEYDDNEVILHHFKNSQGEIFVYFNLQLQVATTQAAENFFNGTNSIYLKFIESPIEVKGQALGYTLPAQVTYIGATGDSQPISEYGVIKGDNLIELQADILQVQALVRKSSEIFSTDFINANQTVNIGFKITMSGGTVGRAVEL